MYNPKFDGKKLESPRDNIDPKAALGEAAGIGMLFFFTVAAVFFLPIFTIFYIKKSLIRDFLLINIKIKKNIKSFVLQN